MYIPHVISYNVFINTAEGEKTEIDLKELPTSAMNLGTFSDPVPNRASLLMGGPLSFLNKSPAAKE